MQKKILLIINLESFLKNQLKKGFILLLQVLKGKIRKTSLAYINSNFSPMLASGSSYMYVYMCIYVYMYTHILLKKYNCYNK